MDAVSSEVEMPRLESHPPGEGAPGQGDNADSPGRRRRRRGGRGGERGERGERAERGPRESREGSAAEENSDAVDSRAAQLAAAHEPAPFHGSAPERIGEGEPMYDPRNDEPSEEPRHEPKHVYTQQAPAPAPVAFKAVIQHDDAEDADSHRPNRRRKHGSDAASEPQPLQLVETQSAPVPQPVEDDLPHRTKPRRRRTGPAEAEPLMLVETQPGAETRAESPPTP